MNLLVALIKAVALGTWPVVLGWSVCSWAASVVDDACKRALGE